MNKRANFNWKPWIFCCFWITSSVATKEKFEDLVKPYNLSVSSHNLNAVLRWSIKVKYAALSPVRDISDDVTYTVLYRKYIPEERDHAFVQMPNCSQIKQQFCRLSMMDQMSNEYRVRAQVRNGTSVRSLTYEYDPSLEERLYPPEFTLTFDESDIIINIPDPARIDWSGEYLYDFLHDFDLEYEIQYWILLDSTSAELSRHTLKEPADILTTRFPVERNKSDTICVRMRLQGQVEYNPGHWSKPVCVAEVPLEKKYNFIGKIVASCVGCLAALLILIVTIYSVKKRYYKFKKTINSPLPSELREVVVDMGGEYHEIFSGDAEPENPIAYRPYENIPIIESAGDSVSGSLDKQHCPITNNNYVTSRPERIPRYRPPALGPTSSPDDIADFDDISDYVGVPSPDSGLGIRMEF